MEDQGSNIYDPALQAQEADLDQTLRPGVLDEYIGQDTLKANLRIASEAAKKRNEPMDHILLYGVSGLGKTTLAYVVAKSMGATIRSTSGPAIERPADLVSLLTNLEEGDILFIDEIHRLPFTVEEVLYSAMEDFRVDVVLGKGPAARSISLDLAPFTLIGATTRLASLSSPLRSRFGEHYKLDFYPVADIKKIIERSARILNVQIDEVAAQRVAESSRQTPRVANRLLKRIRDFAEVENDGHITDELVQRAFDRLGIDHLGLDEVDRRILHCIIEKYHGGPVGLKSLAASIAEEPEAIEDVYEPYLLRSGLLQRTAKGRIASEMAYQHLHLAKPTLL